MPLTPLHLYRPSNFSANQPALCGREPTVNLLRPSFTILRPAHTHNPPTILRPYPTPYYYNYNLRHHHKQTQPRTQLAEGFILNLPIPSDRREQWDRYSDHREDIAGRSEKGPLGMLTEGRHPEVGPEPGGLPLGGRDISEPSTGGRRERSLGVKSETAECYHDRREC